MANQKTLKVTIQRTPTKQDIALVQLLADDNRHCDIAEKLEITEKAVQNDVQRVKTAYGCRTIVALVILFKRNNLIE